MRRRYCIFLTLAVFLLAFGHSLSADQPEPRILADSNSMQGATFDIVVWPSSPGVGYRGILLRDGLEISSNNVINLETPDGTAGVIRIGIPCDIAPDTYTVAVLSEDDDPIPGNPRVEFPVTIRSREFLSEDIHLNERLTSLRTEDRERMAEEARQMLRLLSSFPDVRLEVDEPLQEPLTGRRRTSFYGDRRRYLYADGTTAGSIHTGIDYAAPVGTPVYPGHPATVLYTGERLLTGHTVVVAYSVGLYGLFYHLSEIAVIPGQEVSREVLLGKSGVSGLATGPHLHWEVRVGTVPVSPDDLLGRPLIDKQGIFSIIQAE